MSENNLEISNENIAKTEDNKPQDRLTVKFDLWERKLLDLSTRNSLLNLRIKGSCIPLFVPDCANIEDLIAQDKSFSIKSRGKDDETEEEAEEEPSEKQPVTAEEKSEDTQISIEEPVKEVAETPAEAAVAKIPAEPAAEEKKETEKEEKKKIKGVPAKDYTLVDLPDIGEFEEYIKKNFEKGVLISSITDAVLDKNIKTLYRGAKTSMEENGANTLYFACGFLKWFEKDRKEPCFAPILLIPVELVKKFGIKYTMRKRDEDVQFNITISEKLRQDFGIGFDMFDKKLPADENGVDVEAVFKAVDEAISPFKNKGWGIVRSCVLGLFSFSQFVMWNDMHSHRDSISKNKIVRSLINGARDPELVDFPQMDKVPEEDVFLPIVADSSQLAAIKVAGEGKSFVLHGPPGTGKSQTITSIIANCLANNKKVLFVAEKKAALDVVYKRLEKIGIAPFCLELHSNKIRKSYVLDQLKTASEVRLKSQGDGDYNKSLEDIVAKRKDLDKYVDELHAIRPYGLTLYELINVYASNQSAPDCGAFDEGFANELNAQRIREIESSLGELVASSGNLGGKLPFVRSSAYSQDAKSRLPALVQAFIAAYDEFAASVAGFDNLLTANNCRIAGEPGTVGRIAGLNYAGTSIAKLKAMNLPKGLICCDDTESAYLSLRDAITCCKDAVAKRDALLSVWQPGFLDLDGTMLLSELMTAKAKNALMRGMAENNVYKKVKAYDLKGNRKEVLEQDFKLLSDYKNSVQNAMNYITSVRGYLGEFYNPGAGFPGFDIAQVEALNENAHTAFAGFAAFDPTGYVRKLVGNNDAFLFDAVNAFNSKTAAYSSAYGNLKNTYGFEYGAFEPAADLLESKKQMAQTLLGDSDYLRDRMQFNLMASRCVEYKISNLVKAYDNGVVDANSIISSFRRGYSAMLISMLIDGSDVLRTFSGLVFEKKIDELAKISDDFEKLTRQEIYLRIARNLPNLSKDASASSALGILQHAIKSGGRGVSIRTLFTQIGDLILKLCPCVLMSPLSCAQFLDPDKCGMFDMVVFDEASQLPTCKAIGVIARGKEAVIVGDPKQMPPTSFFAEQVNTDDDNYELDDLESILDDCLAVSMPELYLEWHYRSRHESLITFSNKAFYEGKLYTFPSPDDRQSKVTLVDCGGTFDSGKTRTNKAEAEAVIEELTKRAHDPVLSRYSVGVVTFNIQQQSLIEDMLDLAASKDTELEKWAFGGEEPVFVKNLENVQGDERDVILFSVGYGKDENGKLIMNFGPLNRDVGWRRLNVAVTRSRIEMKVFSSISPEELRITETASEGVKSFKRFLQYASGSTVWDQDIVSTGNSSDNSGSPLIDRSAAFTGIADDICARFKAIGYDTDKGVGKSGFKIDIGVVSPDKEGTYCLGILLDGPVYASSGTTTSREVSQMSMLKGFGWNIVRVWSLEWWENPDSVFEKLVALINDSRKEETKEEVASDVAAPVQEEQSEDVPAEAAESGPAITIYDGSSESEPEETEASEDQAQKKTDDIASDVNPEVVYSSSDIKIKPMTAAEFCDPMNTNQLKKSVVEIVDQESPISSDALARELISKAGIAKMTPKLRERCSYLVKSIEKSANIRYTSQKLDLASEEDDEVIFLWKDGSEIGKVMDFYRVPAEGEKVRKAADIPVQEAACAANYLARSQYGIPYENLITETCKAMGLARAPVDSDNYKLGKRAVDYCMRQQLLMLDDDGFVKCCENE